ncbi:MAG TPA: beta-ribofuranosylaminobenzene 5'-phosphate synthase family protein [Candidatus Polarisedimenticolia bacterium]|nr:beta-ribofuranosylaminobenzene 5'-phosphate synthase family protein [Candidatus Polarisedimenticolia bacterium]
MSIRVTAHARLHFGFLDLSEDVAGRRFGGLGMALSKPRLMIRLERGRGLEVEGPLRERIESMALRVHRALELKPQTRIIVEEAIPEHVGLGSGTQMALALATGIARQRGIDQPVARLCSLAGRAQRSGVGFHLFQAGGLVVEGGHARGGVPFEVPPLLARHEVPEDWRVVVAVPQSAETVSGDMEEAAFRRLRPAASVTVERISRAVLTRLLPALVSRDLPSFGTALTELQDLVGGCFAAVQEGAYHAAAAPLVRLLKEKRACGVGQSSWGPAVYAFAADAREEKRLLGLLAAASPGAILIKARPHNAGALHPGVRAGADGRIRKGNGRGRTSGKTRPIPPPTAATRTGSRSRRRRSLQD